MPEANSFYIITVGGGKCLENTQGAQGVLDCLAKEDSASQQWVVEQGEKENEVAFRSCADGKYLRNNEPNKINWGKIGMGERQWWTLEKGRTPGSCAIRSNACTSGASYLNDFQGKYQDNNYVHMWQMEKHLEFWLTWYLRDANNAAFSAKDLSTSSGGGSDDMQKRKQELDDKERAMKESEEKRTKDLDSREDALKKKEQELAASQKKGAESTTAATGKPKETVQKRDELKKREQSLKAREDALKKREDEMASKEKLNGGSKPTASPKQDDRGYVIRPPPRKIEKKVVGYLYEDQNKSRPPPRKTVRN